MGFLSQMRGEAASKAASSGHRPKVTLSGKDDPISVYCRIAIIALHALGPKPRHGKEHRGRQRHQRERSERRSVYHHEQEPHMARRVVVSRIQRR